MKIDGKLANLGSRPACECFIGSFCILIGDGHGTLPEHAVRRAVAILRAAEDAVWNCLQGLTKPVQEPGDDRATICSAIMEATDEAGQAAQELQRFVPIDPLAVEALLAELG